MNRRVKIGIMVALLVLAVGFAAITTTLIINGTLSIGPDTEGFDRDVVFTKAKTSGKAFITENGKTIQFTADLQDIGQEVDLNYEITNKNRQYDASGTIECGFVDEDNRLNEYITVTPRPEEFNIDASRKKTGHVIVRMIKSFIGSDTSDDDNDPSNIGEIEFKCTIKLEAGERDNLAPETPPVYTDATLNGADPTVGGDLIPVVLSNDGTVTYADLYEDWYDYSNKRWANAVILKDGANFKYDEGDVIKEEDIESYFVWIPRYKYKLWNANQIDGISDSEYSLGKQTIEVAFETKDVEPSIGTQNGEWLTHPAFTNFDVNGIWVGKFETGYDGATSKDDIKSVDANANKIIIKPNSISWQNKSVLYFFNLAYDYLREMDSHMMKNTEWGAVAYLSHSEYGINDIIRINNNSNAKTGYAAVNAPTCRIAGNNECNIYGDNADITLPYNTKTGYLASTTGNITGVYDMSGGSVEAVAAMAAVGKSGLSQEDIEEKSKYFDIYSSDTLNKSTGYNYTKMILGDATGELGSFYNSSRSTYMMYISSWYENNSVFFRKDNSWLYRGGSFGDGTQSGQFAFTSLPGTARNDASFRIVLAY